MQYFKLRQLYLNDTQQCEGSFLCCPKPPDADWFYMDEILCD